MIDPLATRNLTHFAPLVDSFKAVEIRNHVFRELKSEISVFEILSSKPLEELSILIAMRSQLVTAEAKAA